MRGGSCKNILDDAFGHSAGALILFLDDPYMRSHFNIRSVIPIHAYTSEIHTFHTPKDGKYKNIFNAFFFFPTPPVIPDLIRNPYAILSLRGLEGRGNLYLLHRNPANLTSFPPHPVIPAKAGI
jgi:hypothetical protein